MIIVYNFRDSWSVHISFMLYERKISHTSKLEARSIRAFVFENEEPKCWKMLVDAVFATGQELTAKELAADPEVNVPCPTDWCS